jgi:hypothetical protein
MTEYTLNGLKVTIGTPKVVSEGIGHLWFPRIIKFDTGEVLIKHSIAPDSGNLLLTGAGIHVSFDDGETWDFHYNLSEAAEVTVPQTGDGVAGVVFHTSTGADGSLRNLRGHMIRYENGGQTFVFQPWTAAFNGLPRDVKSDPIKGQHGVLVRPETVIHGDIVEIEDGLLSTIYMRYAGDPRYSLVAMTSSDGGYTWEYRSLIASADGEPDALDGPCEATMVRLVDGDLMCIMRAGGGIGQPLWRSYSSDDGRTWSPSERMIAESVDPTVRRLANDVLVLSTGRHGVKLWLSTDDRGQDWQPIDLIAHHNAALPEPEHSIVPSLSADPWERHGTDQTTGYTSMVEISPNRFLLTYDRTPFGWLPVKADSPERGRIYAVAIDVERI